VGLGASAAWRVVSVCTVVVIMAFDFQRLQAALGMSVKLTLTCGVFQGVLHHINPSCDLLLLHTGWGW